MTTSERRMLTSFTESIVLATICGRALSHRQQSTVEYIYGDVSQDCWDRHQWIEAILTERLQVLSITGAAGSELADPLLEFANVMAQTTVLYLYNIAESLPYKQNETCIILTLYENRALSAARQITHITQAFPQLNYFKASPLFPFDVNFRL